VKLKGVVSREGLDEWAASKCIGDTADVADPSAVMANVIVFHRMKVVCAGDFGNVKASYFSLRDENGVS